MTLRNPVVFAVLALFALSAAPIATADGKTADGTVIAKVRYRDSGGDLQPLEGVEVFLFDGEAHYACTDAAGRATFTGVEPDVNLMSATGPAISGMDCANPEFVNPDTGKRMFAVFWDNHHGVVMWDNFQVGSGETTTINYKTRTPRNQAKVCGGFPTTIVGTNGADVIAGTPGDDVIDGRGGNDAIDGAGGNDFICGGNGRDRLYGGDGNDWLFGEAGKDRLFGEGGDDVLNGGALSDKCQTGEVLYLCES